MKKDDKYTKEVELMMRKIKNQKGFSLVELIIVIAIMAILSAVIAPQLFRYIERSKIAVDQYNVGMLNNLTEIKIPPNVNKIETKAFDGNKDLNKVTISSDVKTIGTEIFGKNKGDFAAVYTVGGAGTYIWNGTAWIKQ